MKSLNSASEYFSLNEPRNNLIEPLIDDTVLSHLNNLIGVFQTLKNGNCQLSDAEVRKSLMRLKKVKEALHKINEDVKSSSSSSQSIVTNELMRKSIDMLKNGGKFTKTIHSNGDKVDKKLSYTSVKNLMKVSPCNFSPRATRISKKSSVTKLPKKAPPKHLKSPATSLPRIIKTFYANCRIHRYSDNSHSFEIMQMKSDNSGDSHETEPEVVIVSLASGQTALFKTNIVNNLIVIDDDKNS